MVQGSSGVEGDRAGHGSGLVVFAAFVFVVGFYLFHNLVPPHLIVEQGDQVTLALLAEKRADPSFLCSDFFLRADRRMWRDYPGLILRVMCAHSVLGMSRVWFLGVFTALLAGVHYFGLFLVLKVVGVRTSWACLCALAFSVSFYEGVGGEFWNVGHSRYLVTRTLWTGLAPFWLAFHFGAARRSLLWTMGSGLLLGVSANVHPPSGLFLCVSVCMVWAGGASFRRLGLQRAGAFAGAFAVGALPTICMILFPKAETTSVPFDLYYAIAHLRMPGIFPVGVWSRLSSGGTLPAFWQRIVAMVSVMAWILAVWAWWTNTKRGGTPAGAIRLLADASLGVVLWMTMGWDGLFLLVLALLPFRLEDFDFRIRLCLASVALIVFPMNWGLDVLTAALERPVRVALEMGRASRLVYPFLFIAVGRNAVRFADHLPKGRGPRTAACVVGGFLLFFMSHMPHPSRWGFWGTTALALTLLALFAALRYRRPAARYAALAVLWLSLSASVGAVILAKTPDLLDRVACRGYYAVRQFRELAFLHMCTWARKSTSPEALFYSYPQGDNKFRLHARRGQVFCWKEAAGFVSLCSPGLMEWEERRAALASAHRRRDLASMCARVYEWGARYWICQSPDERPPDSRSRLVYRNPRHLVYRLFPLGREREDPVAGSPP